MPENHAKTIFAHSLSSLMAHTIRAVGNHFLQKGIELDVRIIADTANAIQFQDPRRGATSLLRTRLKPRANDFERDRVTAFIYIHRNANKHLARVCIAHEIYHLLLELNAYIEAGRKEWARIESDKAVEDECNVFAWRLCKYHDLFNHDEALRGIHVYFPPNIFDKPLNMNSTENHLDWPKGIALDPAHPFYKAESPQWL